MVIMAARKRLLSDVEMQQAVETAAEEIEVWRELDMSDEFSDFSNSDLDPTYSVDETSSNDPEDDCLRKRKRRGRSST